jgi:hypothetical protein
MSKKNESLEKIKSYLDDTYFNVQGFSAPNTFDQTYVIKMLTKMVVGVTTVLWTFVELKDYLKTLRGDK